MKPLAMYLLMLLAAGCGGKQSMAEKSAEAYREAQTKGFAAAGDGHHHATPAPATTASDPHAAHRGAAAASSAGSEHAAHAGMQHQAAPSATNDPRAAHGAEEGGRLAREAPGILPGADSRRAGSPAVAGGTPAPQETLKPDAFDAPAPISVREAAKSAPPPEQGLYTCPMHPEVTSDKAGKCPKCGMTLVEKKR